MKATWHRIRFFPEEVSQGKHRHLRNTMLRLYNQKGKPADVALFSTPLLPEGDICMYISPGACQSFSWVFRTYRVRPCEKPALEEVKLVLGKSQVTTLLRD